MPIRVLLADDHQMVRQALKALLDGEGFQVIDEAGDGEQALRLAAEQRPDVAVLDVAMPVLNGLDAAQEMKRVSPKTKTILLTMHAETHYVLRALSAGAKGFLLKTHAAEDLVRALRNCPGLALAGDVRDRRLIMEISRTVCCGSASTRSQKILAPRIFTVRY